MANTRDLKLIKDYVVSILSKKLRRKLNRKKIMIGNKEIEFDGVSKDEDIVVKVINRKAKTSGGNGPSTKLRNTYADCYLLKISNAKRKILVCINEDFYEAFRKHSEGLLNDIELVYVKLPENLHDLSSSIIESATKEMVV